MCCCYCPNGLMDGPPNFNPDPHPTPTPTPAPPPTPPCPTEKNAKTRSVAQIIEKVSAIISSIFSSKSELFWRGRRPFKVLVFLAVRVTPGNMVDWLEVASLANIRPLRMLSPLAHLNIRPLSVSLPCPVRPPTKL